MTAAAIHIRQLARADAPLYREIRLEGLRLAPEAFGAAFSHENVQSLDWFADRLTQSEVFGAFRADALVGSAAFLAGTEEKKAHRGSVFGVYVRPEARGLGVGRRLMETVIATALGRVDMLSLTVTSASEPAQRIYSSLGFVVYGRLTDGLRVAGRSVDEILMGLDLRSGR